jgi:aminoglycoside phosphotransferase (APT) family kinase protein
MVVQQPGRGELIARGNTSDVWAWTTTTVVKILRPGIPEHWAGLEAAITERVGAAGLPVPATDGVIDVDGRRAIVLERITGASMWDHMRDDPGRIPALVDELVDLQCAVLAVGAIDGVPDLVVRLRTKIDAAVELPPNEREAARALLDELEVGSALCHGDFHPANLLGSRGHWIIVDWFDAAVGNAMADLARSSLLMPTGAGIRSAGRHLEGVTTELLDSVNAAYLAALRRRDLVDDGAFATWEAVLAVARMSEPVPTDDLQAIWRRWRNGSPPSAEVGPATRR